jgi:arylsulfatase A-like enzyme
MTTTDVPTAESSERPNVILICTDQQRYDSLGCYGNHDVKTPNIDALAAEGVRFQTCYVQNPVCGPSRASLMTGRYPHANGVWANGVALGEDQPLFTRSLADDGYDCGLVGKLHLTPAFGGRTERRLADGFRYFKWAHDPAHASPDNAYHQWLRERFPTLFTEAQQDVKLFHAMPKEAHYTRWVTDEGIDFIASKRDKGKPFFLWLNYFDPHHPFVAPAEYRSLYDRDALAPPIGSSEELASKPPIHAEASRESHAGNAPGFVDYTPAEIQEIRATYYAMVSQIDFEVGRLLSVLEERGLKNDTLVIFTSDHGEMLGDHGLLLKGPLFYEGAVRVPLVMRWSNHLPQSVCEETTQWMDVGATILDAVGIAQPEHSEARSLLRLLAGDERPRGWALSEYRDSCFPYQPPVHATMLRAGTFKLVVYHAAPATDRERAGELYDLESDPTEEINLWDDPAHRSTRSELVAALLDVLVGTEDRSRPREALF